MKFFFFLFFSFFFPFFFVFLLYALSYFFFHLFGNSSSSFECGFSSFMGPMNFFSMPFFVLSVMFLLFDVEILLVCFLPMVYNFHSVVFILFWFIIFFILAFTLYEWVCGGISWI